MRKQTWICIILLVALCLLFVKVQSMIVGDREGRRVEEKILMLSDRPEVTKILALGNDSTVADLLWIRAIQYFGGNFSTLHTPEKKQGMINLFRNMVVLDPHFVAAFQFGGFVINESIKDANLAMSFLMEGADKNPDAWRLRFDAGFIAFYQLKDYDTAKRLFIQTALGNNYAQNSEIQVQGLVDGFSAKTLTDDDLQSQTKFHPENGSIILDLKNSETIGRIKIDQTTFKPQSFRLAFADGNTLPSPEAFHVIPSVTASGIYSVTPTITARYARIDEMKTTAEDGLFELAEVQLHGPEKANVPSYVLRMAYEMDRAAGRFRAAWEQYFRYYIEAKEKGDEVSADLASQKLDSIHTSKVTEILTEAIKNYQEKEGKFPSPPMHELVEQGYIQQVLQQKMAEDPTFAQDILPVLIGANQNVYNILTTWDNSSPYLMLTTKTPEGKEDWYITTRTALEAEQKMKLETLQRLVDQYKEENGHLPTQLEDLKTGRVFNASENIFEDPLGGQFQVDSQTGKVVAVNPKY